MKKLSILLLCVFSIFFSATSFAQYMTSAEIRFDSRYFPEFVYARGGAEGHSGAYISFSVSVIDYDDLQKVDIKAKHLDTDFEVTLLEAAPECAGVWPFAGVDQYYGVRLQPNEWMTGEWEITLKYRTTEGVHGREQALVVVPRFNSPPEPTGIQGANVQGQKWLVWNSIGEPGVGPDSHIEYRIMHLTGPDLCIDESYTVRPGGNIYYELWSGNRIAVERPAHWQPGDLIRIENRVYSNIQDVYRFDRGTRYFYLPNMP